MTASQVLDLAASARHLAAAAPARTIDDWDWPAIRHAEAQARRRGAKHPLCDVCERRMWCGQSGHHHVCESAAA